MHRLDIQVFFNSGVMAILMASPFFALSKHFLINATVSLYVAFRLDSCCALSRWPKVNACMSVRPAYNDMTHTLNPGSSLFSSQEASSWRAFLVWFPPITSTCTLPGITKLSISMSDGLQLGIFPNNGIFFCALFCDNSVFNFETCVPHRALTLRQPAGSIRFST